MMAKTIYLFIYRDFSPCLKLALEISFLLCTWQKPDFLYKTKFFFSLFPQIIYKR